MADHTSSVERPTMRFDEDGKVCQHWGGADMHARRAPA